MLQRDFYLDRRKYSISSCMKEFMDVFRDESRILSLKGSDLMKKLFYAMYPIGWAINGELEDSIFLGSDFNRIRSAIEAMFGTTDMLGYMISESSAVFDLELNLKDRDKEFYDYCLYLSSRFIFNPHNGLIIDFAYHATEITVGKVANPIPHGPVDYVQNIAQVLKAKTLTRPQAHKINNCLSDVFGGCLPSGFSWGGIKRCEYIDTDENLIIPVLDHYLKGSFDKTVFIGYISPHVPYMQTDLQTVLKNFDELRKIPLNKYIFNPFYGYMIELRHVGDIIVGVVPKIYYRQFADTWWHGYGEVK